MAPTFFILQAIDNKADSVKSITPQGKENEKIISPR